MVMDAAAASAGVAVAEGADGHEAGADGYYLPPPPPPIAGSVASLLDDLPGVHIDGKNDQAITVHPHTPYYQSRAAFLFAFFLLNTVCVIVMILAFDTPHLGALWVILWLGFVPVAQVTVSMVLLRMNWLCDDMEIVVDRFGSDTLVVRRAFYQSCRRKGLLPIIHIVAIIYVILYIYATMDAFTNGARWSDMHGTFAVLCVLEAIAGQVLGHRLIRPTLTKFAGEEDYHGDDTVLSADLFEERWVSIFPLIWFRSGIAKCEFKRASMRLELPIVIADRPNEKHTREIFLPCSQPLYDVLRTRIHIHDTDAWRSGRTVTVASDVLRDQQFYGGGHDDDDSGDDGDVIPSGDYRNDDYVYRPQDFA
jgi:hypothetical protein